MARRGRFRRYVQHSRASRTPSPDSLTVSTRSSPLNAPARSGSIAYLPASARSPACAHLVTRCAIGRARCASCCSANASIRTAPSVALRGMRRARPWPSFGPGGVRQGRSRHASKCRRHGALVNLQENVDLVGDRADRALDGKPERCVLVLVEGVQHAFVSRLKAKLGKLGGLCDDAELRTVEAGGALTSREVCPDRTMRSRARR